MKPLVVGYAPVTGSPGDRYGVAFVGTDSGRRLARYAGLGSDRDLLDHLDMVNLFRDPEATWSRATAQRRAQAIVDRLIVGRTDTVVLLSTSVCHAFRVTYHPLFQWVKTSRAGWKFRAASCPHPSGLVRWWNDPGNVASAGAFLEALRAPLSA